MPIDYVAKIQQYTYADLLKLLVDIRQGKPIRGWAAGKAFEHLILRGFELEGAEVVYPYNVKLTKQVVEQIDGAVYSRGLACLIESKDRQDVSNFEPAAKMRSQLMRRPPGTMGLIFARSGFTAPMKELMRLMNPLQILLWEREELEYSLDKQRMCDALQMKYRHAVEHGIPDYTILGKL